MHAHMSNLYFDLQNGISGDMAVAAILSLDDDLDYLNTRLKHLDISGYELEYTKEKRNGIRGRSFRVVPHDIAQTSRSYRDITHIISSSRLSQEEKKLSLAIFENIARAESKVHGVGVSRVHFHEVGAIDSIIDIVSFSLLYIKHRITRSRASLVRLGSGTTEGMHGTIPVPSPATLEILKGLPVVGTDNTCELTTPTGAAIIRTTAERFGHLPQCIIEEIGMGFGSRREPGINALRILKYRDITDEFSIPAHMVVVTEVTIDDSTPEEISFLQDALFKQGALDVYVTPIHMKKSRSAFNITVLSNPESFERCARTILLKSSSFGLRYQYYFRKTLDRTIEKVSTEYGTVGVKIGYLNGTVLKISPEYEDCRKKAEEHDVSLRTIFERVYQEAARRFPTLKTGIHLLSDQSKE